MKRWIKALRSFVRRIDGSTAIEFGIIAPVLIALLGGIIEGGRLMWIRNSIQSATEQAARYVIVNPAANDSQITAVANNYYAGVGGGAPVFTVAHETVSGVNFVAIEGSYEFQSILSLVDFGVVTLHGKARAPVG